MRINDLVDKLANLSDDAVHSETQVVVQDTETGKTYTLKDVVVEYHEDTYNNTIWIQVEES